MLLLCFVLLFVGKDLSDSRPSTCISLTNIYYNISDSPKTRIIVIVLSAALLREGEREREVYYIRFKQVEIRRRVFNCVISDVSIDRIAFIFNF